MKDQPLDVGDYVARLPYAVGHQLGNQDLVIGALGTDHRSIVQMVTPWNEHTHTATEITEQLARMLSRIDQPAALTIVGYGPHGGRRAHQIAGELQQAVQTDVLPIHVHDDTWRVLFDNQHGHWTLPQPIPDPAAELATRGVLPPAASRTALEASITPLPKPTFTPLDAAKATELDALSPRQRAELATTTLDRIAAARLDDPAQMCLLAHLTTSDVITRDTVLAHTLEDRIHDDRVDALVRTYRAAPPEQRPQLAALAAAATYFACWHPPQIRGLLKQADPLTTFPRLITAALNAGFDPRKAHHTVRNGAAEGLRDAQEAWTAAHDHTLDPNRDDPAPAPTRTKAKLGEPTSPPTTPSRTDRDAPGL
ncbi:hypothetical protein [Myceligenerans xiligouense]|uniref:DUF4192 domain-containing protein n=1 Tax=Myceligenerans xiligouense TaxID=253184 RepID=A0A3N4YPL1_9MICO|nr:hypothetical protein [Myceligenerans xiligouense]RPF21304.1 hypothetical protein EDD34_1929 [Myceligenerans xiligouense]